MSDEWNTNNFHEWYGPYNRSKGSSGSGPTESWFTRVWYFIATILPAVALLLAFLGTVAVIGIYVYAHFCP